jgi:hypothetical protein
MLFPSFTTKSQTVFSRPFYVSEVFDLFLAVTAVMNIIAIN